MKAEITITLKPAVRDPQGQSIAKAMKRLGFDAVKEVRQGKHIEIEFSDKVQEEEVKKLCEQLLANPVIENYAIKMSD